MNRVFTYTARPRLYPARYLPLYHAQLHSWKVSDNRFPWPLLALLVAILVYLFVG